MWWNSRLINAILQNASASHHSSAGLSLLYLGCVCVCVCSVPLLSESIRAPREHGEWRAEICVAVSSFCLLFRLLEWWESMWNEETAAHISSSNGEWRDEFLIPTALVTIWVLALSRKQDSFVQQSTDGKWMRKTSKSVKIESLSTRGVCSIKNEIDFGDKDIPLSDAFA